MNRWSVVVGTPGRSWSLELPGGRGLQPGGQFGPDPDQQVRVLQLARLAGAQLIVMRVGARLGQNLGRAKVPHDLRHQRAGDGGVGHDPGRGRQGGQGRQRKRGKGGRQKTKMGHEAKANAIAETLRLFMLYRNPS